MSSRARTSGARPSGHDGRRSRSGPGDFAHGTGTAGGASGSNLFVSDNESEAKDGSISPGKL
jgi:hypothetical protein